MRTYPLLDLVIPYHPQDQHHLQRLLDSIRRQGYPQDRITLHVVGEGNSEEAKAIGIKRCSGDIIGMLCTDNVLLEPDFLEVMVDAASQLEVTGSFTERYAWVKEDAILSRYFALIGANDPLCWWLQKADRASYLSQGIHGQEVRNFQDNLPSLGDNGFFFKRQILQRVVNDPAQFGSCMCVSEDLRRLGHANYARISTHAIWHRSGESFWKYLKKRWRYTNDLYFDKLHTRRWVMVRTSRDWALVGLFALCSLLVVPQVLLSAYGYIRKRDLAWAYHPLICFILTLIYACSFLRSALSFRRLTGRRSLSNVWRV